MNELQEILDEINNLNEIGDITKINQLNKQYKKIIEGMRPEEVLFMRLINIKQQYQTG
jgi:hypothetical protein